MLHIAPGATPFGDGAIQQVACHLECAELAEGATGAKGSWE